MRKPLLALAVLTTLVASTFAQTQHKVITRPKLPPRDSLERMNLKLAWNARVTVDGDRDGIFSIQVLPGKQSQVLVQTYKGAVFLYDGDTGDLVWKNLTVGTAYWTPQVPAFNSHSIFVTRRNVVHVLSRFDGRQRVYT